jgi:hypothetical protein
LTVVPDAGEAEILCRMLRAERIRCTHRVTDVAAERGSEFGGWREILVDRADLSRARELLPDR